MNDGPVAPRETDVSRRHRGDNGALSPVVGDGLGSSVVDRSLRGSLQRALPRGLGVTIAELRAAAEGWLSAQLAEFATLIGLLSDWHELRAGATDRAEEAHRRAAERLAADRPEEAWLALVEWRGWRQVAETGRELTTAVHRDQACWLRALVSLQLALDELDREVAAAMKAHAIDGIERLQPLVARELLVGRWPAAPGGEGELEPWRWLESLQSAWRNLPIDAALDERNSRWSEEVGDELARLVGRSGGV